MDEIRDNCIFCRIAGGKSPAQIEYQDNDVIAFWDIQPNAPIHILVIPKQHIPTLREASRDNNAILGAMMLAAAEIARRKGLEKEGYRVVINTGSAANQIVDHIHAHLLGGAELGPMTSAKGNPVSQYT